MAIYRMQWDFRITDDAVSGSGCTVALYLRFRSDHLGAQLGTLIAYRDATDGIRNLWATAFFDAGPLAEWLGAYALNTWYTLEIQVEESGSALIVTIWIDGDQKLTHTSSVASITDPTASMAVSGASGTWSLRAEIDDFIWKVDGATVLTDGFGDGDLTDWPAEPGATFADGESGGIYWGDDSGGSDKITLREQEMPTAVPTVGKVHLCRDKAGILYRAAQVGSRCKVWRSTDSGATWSGPWNVAIGSRPTLVPLPSGRLLCSFANSGKCKVRSSDDRGQTWSASFGVQTGSQPYMWIDPKGYILHRSYYTGGQVKHQVSFDAGVTWAVATNVKAEAAEVAPEGVCLEDGRPLVAFYASAAWTQRKNPRLDGGGTWA